MITNDNIINDTANKEKKKRSVISENNIDNNDSNFINTEVSNQETIINKKKLYDFFKLDFVLANLSYVLFLSFLIIFYIANGHTTIKMIRKINKLTKEDKELTYEYLIYKNELTQLLQKENIINSMEKNGLKQVKQKPDILIDSLTDSVIK